MPQRGLRLHQRLNVLAIGLTEARKTEGQPANDDPNLLYFVPHAVFKELQ